MRAIEEAKRAVFLGSKSTRQFIKRKLAAEQQEPRVVFVTGVQRSGTNMLMTLFERSPNTDVYHEADGRAFDEFIMREPGTIDEIYRTSNADVVVIKALHEAQVLKDLLARFPDCCAVWMFRDYRDVINSQMHRWPGFKNKIDRLVVDRNSADWRGVNMTDETLEIVRSHYTPDISVEDASALFWFYRNRIYFDQRMADEGDAICLLKYEEVVARPKQVLPAVYRFLGMEVPSDFSRFVSGQSVRKHPEPQLSPAIRELCEGMLAMLEERWQEQALVP